MKILKLIYCTVGEWFYATALRQINPMHPDVPRIVLRRAELAEQARKAFA